MSKNGSVKEFLLSLYLYKNKEILENLLKFKINKLVLDKLWNTRKIDMHGLDDENRAVFIEIQLSSSDNIHLNQLLEVARVEENVTLVWIATDFREEIVSELINNVKEKGNIDLYLVKLNKEIITLLNVINRRGFLEKSKDLYLLNVCKKPLSMYKKIKGKTYPVIINNIEKGTELDKRKKFLLMVIERLTNTFDEYINVYRYKDVKNHRMTLGIGKSYVDLRVAFNKLKQLEIAMVFYSIDGERCYSKIREYEEEIKSRLDYNCFWEINKVYTSYKIDWYHEEMYINITARLIEKYVRCFVEYIDKTV